MEKTKIMIKIIKNDLFYHIEIFKLLYNHDHNDRDVLLNDIRFAFKINKLFQIILILRPVKA